MPSGSDTANPKLFLPKAMSMNLGMGSIAAELGVAQKCVIFVGDDVIEESVFKPVR
jgi:hypothetical protein